MRYYYKHKENKSFLNLKTPLNDENYIEITEEEFNELTYVEPLVIDNTKATKRKEISRLKAQLQATDYQAIKYAEGWLTEEEYAPIKAERQAMRNRINELEGML
jgi:hypothetical protein